MSRTVARGGRILLTSRRLVGDCVRNKADKLVEKLDFSAQASLLCYPPETS